MILLRIVRLLVMVFLVAVAFSLARRVFRWLYARSMPTRPPRAPDLGPNFLHRDPVCGKNVAASISHTLRHAGETYHFCSPECRSRFLETHPS